MLMENGMNGTLCCLYCSEPELDVLMLWTSLQSLVFHEFGVNFAQLVTELIKVIINKAKHLNDGAEQQDVAVHIQL